MGFDEARHLLSRATFGATPAEIQAVAAMDYEAAKVDRLLATWHGDALTALPDGLNKSPEDQARALCNWWVEEMLATNQPLVERMTLFWHNHFTSALGKVGSAPAMYRQNALFRREAFGNLARLLKAVARDPAMLIYLDGAQSVARQPNENFAREMLELFTLGEGHYSEADVKNAARAFTGWSIARKCRSSASIGTTAARRPSLARPAISMATTSSTSCSAIRAPPSLCAQSCGASSSRSCPIRPRSGGSRRSCGPAATR